LMTFFKCWMEDAGFEVFLRVLAGGCRFWILFTSAGWRMQGLKTFYKCWLEVAGFLNIVYKCWLEDAGYEFCLQMLAGGLQSLNTVNKCWL
jgi:hypothetical protein